MGLFDHKTNITLSAHSNVFTSTPSQMRIIKNFGLVKATTSEISAKYHNEDDELLSILLSRSFQDGCQRNCKFPLYLWLIPKKRRRFCYELPDRYR